MPNTANNNGATVWLCKALGHRYQMLLTIWSNSLALLIIGTQIPNVVNNMNPQPLWYPSCGSWGQRYWNLANINTNLQSLWCTSCTVGAGFVYHLKYLQPWPGMFLGRLSDVADPQWPHISLKTSTMWYCYKTNMNITQKWLLGSQIAMKFVSLLSWLCWRFFWTIIIK